MGRRRISVGRATVQRQFGMSMISLTRPCTGAQEKQHAGLLGGVAEPLAILDGVEAGAAARDARAQGVRPALVVDGDALEDHALGVAGLDPSGLEARVEHAVTGHAALDQVDLQVDPARHVALAPEGDLSVTLGEVQVAHRPVGAPDVHGEVHAGAARRVLDVEVAAVLAGRDGAGPLGGDPVERRPGAQAAEDRVLGRGQAGERRDARAVRDDEVRLVAVPRVERGLGRGAADEARVWSPDEADVEDVPRFGEDAPQVPYRLVRAWEQVGPKAPAVARGDHGGHRCGRGRPAAR